MIIGLTGGIASGKSTAADELKMLGATVIDADKVGHECIELERVRTWIAAHCPDAINTDGSVDRATLGKKVFADEKLLKTYNAVIHPEIRRELKRRASEADGDVVIEAAILIETGMHDIVDEVWLVTADEDVRIDRMRLRNGYTEAEARARIAAQMSDEEKRKFADKVIDNSGGEAELRESVRRIYKKG